MVRLVLFIAILPLLWQSAQTQPTTQPGNSSGGRFEVKPVTPGQPTMAPAAAGQQGPAPTTQMYDKGPLRAELMGVVDMRVKLLEAIPNAPKDSTLRMQYRIQGERVEEIAKIGNILITEAIDDTGKVLIDPNLISDLEKTAMRGVTMPAERLKSGALTLPAQLSKAPERKANTLKKIRGTVRVVLAKSPEQITVPNPVQYLGGALLHPRLAELGIEIVNAKTDGVSQAPPPERSIVLLVKTKKDNVKSTQFFDGSMRPIRPRESPVTLATGEAATGYVFDPATQMNDVQVVFDVYPVVDDLNLPIAIDDFQLP